MWHKGHAAWSLMLSKLGEMAQESEPTARSATSKKAKIESEELSEVSRLCSKPNLTQSLDG
eukprot:1161446-Pelagomonas_calceolata.AAC.10